MQTLTGRLESTINDYTISFSIGGDEIMSVGNPFIDMIPYGAGALFDVIARAYDAGVMAAEHNLRNGGKPYWDESQ